jgi:hypothetical protein
LSSVDGTAGSSLGGTDEGISEAAVVAIEGFVNDSNNIKDSPPGAEGDGEVPLRAEGLGLVPLSSVDGMAGDFPRGFGESASRTMGNPIGKLSPVAHHFPG